MRGSLVADECWTASNGRASTIPTRTPRKRGPFERQRRDAPPPPISGPLWRGSTSSLRHACHRDIRGRGAWACWPAATRSWRTCSSEPRTPSERPLTRARGSPNGHRRCSSAPGNLYKSAARLPRWPSMRPQRQLPTLHWVMTQALSLQAVIDTTLDWEAWWAAKSDASHYLRSSLTESYDVGERSGCSGRW